MTPKEVVEMKIRIFLEECKRRVDLGHMTQEEYEAVLFKLKRELN